MKMTAHGKRRAITWRNAVCLALLSLPVMAHAHAQEKTIAIIVPTLKITVLQTESAAAEAEAKKLGYKTILLTHDFNTTKELQDAQQLIIEKVAGVAWNVADPASSDFAVQKVRNAGIPVVNMDRVLTQPTVASASFESDNYQCGALAAQAFIAMVGNTGTYAELPGPQSDQMGRTRSAGYHSVLDKSDLKMVARQPANYDETRGFQLAGSILQGHPDIKGFVTGNDFDRPRRRRCYQIAGQNGHGRGRDRRRRRCAKRDCLGHQRLQGFGSAAGGRHGPEGG